MTDVKGATQKPLSKWDLYRQEISRRYKPTFDAVRSRYPVERVATGENESPYWVTLERWSTANRAEHNRCKAEVGPEILQSLDWDAASIDELIAQEQFWGQVGIAHLKVLDDPAFVAECDRVATMQLTTYQQFQAEWKKIWYRALKRVSPEIAWAQQKWHRERTRPRVKLAPQDRERIYVRDSGMCWICHTEVGKDTFVLDHVWPVIYGGGDEETNLAVAHRNCNLERGSPLPGLLEMEEEADIRQRIRQGKCKAKDNRT